MTHRLGRKLGCPRQAITVCKHHRTLVVVLSSAFASAFQLWIYTSAALEPSPRSQSVLLSVLLSKKDELVCNLVRRSVHARFRPKRQVRASNQPVSQLSDPSNAVLRHDGQRGDQNVYVPEEPSAVFKRVLRRCLCIGLVSPPPVAVAIAATSNDGNQCSPAPLWQQGDAHTHARPGCGRQDECVHPGAGPGYQT